MKVKKLTARQERFCIEVVKGKSYSDAFRIAYNAKNYQSESLWVKASQLRAQDKVRLRIEDLQERLVSRCLMTRQQWLEKADLMCRADVRKIFNAQGDVKEIHELADEEASIIAGIEVEENFAKVGDKTEHVGYIKKIKLVPPDKRIELYGKVRGWLKEEEKKGDDNSVSIHFYTLPEGDHEKPNPHGVIDVTPSASDGLDDGGSGGNGALIPQGGTGS